MIIDEKIIIAERVKKIFAESIDLIVAKNIIENWYEKYGELEEYLELNNGEIPPEIHPLKGWIKTQRTLKNQGKLTKKRERLLDKLIPKGWYWNPIEDKWMEKYNELKEYYKNNPERRTISGEMESLQKWCQDQRERKELGKLSEERIKLLEKLELWAWNLSDALWLDNFYEAKHFEDKNDHLFFDTKSSIYYWLRREYYRYRDEINEFNEKQKKLFESFKTLWMLKEEITQTWFFTYK